MGLEVSSADSVEFSCAVERSEAAVAVVALSMFKLKHSGCEPARLMFRLLKKRCVCPFKWLRSGSLRHRSHRHWSNQRKLAQGYVPHPKPTHSQRRSGRQAITFRSFESFTSLCERMGMIASLRSQEQSILADTTAIFDRIIPLCQKAAAIVDSP